MSIICSNQRQAVTYTETFFLHCISEFFHLHDKARFHFFLFLPTYKEWNHKIGMAWDDLQDKNAGYK